MVRYLVILFLSFAPCLLFANGEAVSFHVMESEDLQKLFDERNARKEEARRGGPKTFKKELTDASLFSGTPISGTPFSDTPRKISLYTKDYSYRITTQMVRGKIWFDIHRWNSDKTEHIHCKGSGDFPRSSVMWITPGWQTKDYAVVFYRIVYMQ